MAIETKYQARASGYITYEQYLARETENHCTEWVDGRVITRHMVANEHNVVSGFLMQMLQLWAEEHQAGVVRYEVFNMKTGPGLPGRSPDIMFIAEANRGRIKHNYLEGPCDLAIEVVSPDYREVDTVEEFAEYAQGGVPEYWIVDYAVRQARFYSLNANGEYEAIPIGADGIVYSRILPGLWLNVAWLWQDPTPTSRELMRVWNLL